MAAPGKGQYNVSNGVYTFGAEDAGTVVSITYAFSLPTSTSNGQPLTALSLTMFPGERPQSAWGYLESNHADQALNYAGLAYVADESMDLGVSATLPQLSYEVVGLKPFGGGIMDANPADVLTDIWTDPNHGLALDSGLLGDLTQWSNYCVSNGLFLSPVLDQQQAVSQTLQELLDVTNSMAGWWDGKLQIVPYGDRTTVGNGATYTPQTQPVYDLTDDDFTGSGAPIEISRIDLADTFNAVQIEWVDRANQYNTAICEEKNEDAVNKYGLRMDSVRSYHSITTPAVAAMAANAILKRNLYIVSTYKFSTDWRYCLLTPGDLVTLTDSLLGLDRTPARITRVTEHNDGTLDFEAEEFPWGTATATEYPKEAGAPYIPQSNADPGPVNAPLVFESTSRQANFAGYQLNMALSGASADWGGCNIWASVDGSSYQVVGTVKARANMGVLSAALASGGDPDTTNTLAVDLSSSLGQLVSATDAEADAAQTLCWVDGELVTFGTATLTAAYQYNLTYLRRGVFGSTIASHASGAKFCRLDGAVFTWALDPDWVGKTLHLKFTSFNAYGRSEQSLADVTDYTYSVAGSGPGAITPAGKAGPSTVTWSALLGDTSGDTSTPIGDGGNKRFVHDVMSGPTQALIRSDSKFQAGAVLSDGDTDWNVKGVGDAQVLAIDAETSGVLPQDRHDPTVLLSAITGAQVNLVPDSSLKHPSVFWTAQAGGLSVVFGRGAGANLFIYTGTGALDTAHQGETCQLFDVVPGQTYTLSAYLDGTVGFTGTDAPRVLWMEGGTEVASIPVVSGQANRYSVTRTVPSGVSQVQVMAYAGASKTVPAGQQIAFGAFQFESGSAMTAYRENILDSTTGFIPHGAMSDAVRAAIEALDGDGKANLSADTKALIALDELLAASLLTSKLSDDAALGQTAHWSGVSGTGKPADNATVGATWGSNLSGTPTELTDGRVSLALGAPSGGRTSLLAATLEALAFALMSAAVQDVITDHGDGTGQVKSTTKLPSNSPYNVTSTVTFYSTVQDQNYAEFAAYGPGGVGTAWSLIIGSTVTSKPATTVYNCAFSAEYYFSWDVAGGFINAWTSLSSAFADGQVYLGRAPSCAADGSGAAYGGGGSSGTGTSGGGGGGRTLL